MTLTPSFTEMSLGAKVIRENKYAEERATRGLSDAVRLSYLKI
jgi:hypothetical protein